MQRDELKQPLRKRSLTERLWQARPTALVAAYALTFTSFAAGGAWLLRQPMPFAGEPLVTLAIPAVEKIQTAKLEPAPETAAAMVEPVAGPENNENIETEFANLDVGSTSSPAEGGGQKVVKLSNNVMVVTGAHQGLTKAPNSTVTEGRAEGPLPRISSSGKRPSDIYAKPFPMDAVYSDAPKIVLILGGMGLNEKLTKRAAMELPGEVTFAFAPYGNNLQDQVNRARSSGHEVFLQLPLEPVGYPANSPGPKTLLADGNKEENQDNLLWHMSRFLGYSGVVNYMGGRFMSAPEAVKPMLKELKQRGITFIEDGSLPLSATEDVAEQIHMPVRRASSVIDANPDAASILSALAQLEEQAKNGGTAIGTGSGLDVTINTVREWITDAQNRGVIIIPATAAFKSRTG